MKTIKLEIKGNFLRIIYVDLNQTVIMIRGLVNYKISNDESLLTLRTEQSTNQVSYKLKIEDIVDSSDSPFADIESLESFLSDNLGFSSGGGNGQGVTISQKAENYSSLVDGSEIGDLAYVENSEGTSWLPSTVGGTYYPAGIYVWNGNEWVSDRNAIVNQLEQTILNVDDLQQNKLSVVITDGSLSGDGTLSSPLSSIGIESGVQSVGGQGVDNTDPSNPKITFPDADQVDDDSTNNKFITQNEKDLIVNNSNDINQNTSDITTNSSNISQLTSDLSTRGDMFKATYDVNDNGIVDKAQNVIYKAELNQSAVKGNLLYAVGRNPITGDAIVGLADNTVSFADKTVGMALENGNAGDVIEVVKIGVIEDIDTSLFSVGETVYLSTTGKFDKKINITTGVFNPIGYVVLSGFGNGAIIIDTSATESIDTDNTINKSNKPGRTLTDVLNSLGGGREYRSAQATISRTNQTTVALANQQANVFEEYFTDNFTPLATDNFTLSVRWKWSSDNTQNSAFFRVTFSDGINPDIVLLTITEPKDASGGGEIVNVLESGAIVGNVNTGTAERLNGYEIADLVLTQGVTYNLKLEWASEIANADLTVYSSTIRWEQNTITQ